MNTFFFIKGMDIHLPAALMLNKPKQLFLRSKFGHVDVTCRPGKTTCRCKSHLQILSNTQNKSLDNQFKAPVGLNMDPQKLPNPLREPHFQAPRYMWRMQPTVSSFYQRLGDRWGQRHLPYISGTCYAYRKQDDT